MMSRLNKRLQHRPPLFGSQEGFVPKQGAHIGRWTTNKGVFHSVRCRWQYVFPADVTNSRMKMQQHSDGVSKPKSYPRPGTSSPKFCSHLPLYLKKRNLMSCATIVESLSVIRIVTLKRV